MRLTTKGRFAVTAMIDLALRELDRPVTLAGISERQRISLSYLEQLFGKLRKHGLVESIRGPGGGYRIARQMDKITVADIVTAVDEPIGSTMAESFENLTEKKKCLTQDLWNNLNNIILDYLRSVTLRDLVEKQKGVSESATDDPCRHVNVLIYRNGIKQYVTT
ncbi:MULTISPECIES: Rrf2 family transcriptional regulator [Candidatus Ichthyocystis]|uniref:HTH-type transcriptional regulator n=1 Tax=Candidatus Ichthyocystis hellenicum TaxID=1561003 RepID=A0A0S4M1H2_9BURK|nr:MULTISPECIES: Rrf2 family transcriptional regulator [Ichthyocystis]CUT17621.1 HTH-type transcriptional regulator [Candidatus Ichthyocystis hellenicum]